MFTRITRYLSAAVCAIGLMAATGAQAGDRDDDWRHGRKDRHQESRHHDRDGRHEGRRHHYRSDHRGSHIDWPSERNWRGERNWRQDHRGHRHHSRYRRDDRRYYGHTHFYAPIYAPVRYYSRAEYADYGYRGGPEATVILSFPL